MFPVADQFSLAFDAVPAAQLENNSELKSFYDGVKMTQGELLSAFERNKVSEGKNLKFLRQIFFSVYSAHFEQGNCGIQC